MITVTAAGPALAAAAPGFGHAISGAGPVFLAFLAVHVPAGLTAVISGVLAATAPKRRGRHTRAGTVYYWAITAVFATAAAMTAMRPARDWYLALLGALAFLLAAAGRHARRHPRSWPWRDHPPGHTPHITAMGGSYTVLLTAFYVDNGKNLPLWDRLPAAAGLSTDEAACVPVAFGTAHDALFEFGRLQPGETLLVHAGAGGVGIAAIQLAKRAGARVLATPSSDDKLARLAWFGLDHGINYRAADFAAQTRRLTGGHGADVILDGVGGQVLAESLGCLAYRGCCVSFGDAGRQHATPVDISGLRYGSQSVTGYFLGAELYSGDRARRMIAGLLDDIAAGQLRVVIDRIFPLAEAAAAHAYIESRKAFGRVLLSRRQGGALPWLQRAARRGTVHAVNAILARLTPAAVPSEPPVQPSDITGDKWAGHRAGPRIADTAETLARFITDPVPGPRWQAQGRRSPEPGRRALAPPKAAAES